MKDRNYMRRNRSKKGPIDSFAKTEFERRKTQDEVKQIKKNLENFAHSTWSKFWVKSILKIGRPFRMQRGINYALEDRVETLLINAGHIFSTVQGTAPTPYRINIYFQTIPEAEWKDIIEEIARSPWNLIQLMEGVLPEDIIKIFEEKRYPLFPDIENEGLNAICSCPDKEIPCKHIAATILYIARVLDYNPFILLELKGMNKNDLLKELHLNELLEERHSVSSEFKKEKGQREEKRFGVPKLTLEEILSMEKEKKKDLDIFFRFRTPSKIFDIPENLGIPPNLENPIAFEIVFKGIYQFISKEIHDMALKLDD